MVIPFLVGVLSFLDIVFPQKKIQSEIIDKSSSYRAKFDRTTYTIYFNELSDQFSEEVYNQLNVGDRVVLVVSFFNKEVQFFTRVSDSKVFVKDTGEEYFEYGFAITYVLMSVFVWFQKGYLRSLVAQMSVVVIFISSMSLLRIITNLSI